jgi:uncharacterized protein (UPF0248 family)
MIRDILNQILWDKRLRAEDYTITFIHRGAENDKKIIPFQSITTISTSFFGYEEGAEYIIIPFHRILKIENIKTGEIIWQKRVEN